MASTCWPAKHFGAFLQLLSFFSVLYSVIQVIMLSMKREDSTLLLGDPRNNRANSFCTSMAGNVDVLRSFVDSMRHLVVEFKHLLTLKPRDLRLKKTDV